MSRFRSRVLLAALGVGAAVGSGSTAHATPPEHFDYDFDAEFVDTETCAAEPWGFDISATQHEHGEVTIFFDEEGNFVRGVNHLDLRFNISANGITLIERDRFNIFFDEDGHREVGLWTHIQGPAAGIVLLDAGQLVFDADDNLVRAPGRHPQFFGASFCDALVPTG
jgi:hypothetical protein